MRQQRHWRFWGVGRYLVGLTLVALALAVAQIATPQAADPTIVSIRKSRVYQDPEALVHAWELPVARAYSRAGFAYQSNRSLCGPASLANTLRSIGYRTDENQVLVASRLTTIFGYLPIGISLDQMASLAKSQAAPFHVRVQRDMDLATFRKELKGANDPTRRIIVNFSRRPLFGIGGGHHSPILAYDASADLVLVGDVNADFKPWLVSTAQLFSAMDTVDSATGRKRGLVILER